jgi:hypothetical protein
MSCCCSTDGAQYCRSLLFWRLRAHTLLFALSASPVFLFRLFIPPFFLFILSQPCITVYRVARFPWLELALRVLIGAFRL